MITTTARRILVADDNVDNSEMIALLLQASGHDVRIVHDGEAAITEAERFLPHVLLLDLTMPRVSGLEACQRIREAAWSTGMVIVAITGWAAERERQRTRDAGFDLHLAKPVEPDLVLRLARDGHL